MPQLPHDWDRVLTPAQQVDPSSQLPSQSSSRPLQVSEGGTQLSHPQEVLHECVPVVPQLVVQLPVDPRQQVNPLSQPLTQSSSTPLHVSDGGVQVPHAQELLQVCVPVVPQLVVQLPELFRQQVNPLSHAPLQSSSTPLQVSDGGTQLPQSQLELQVCWPVVPHDAVHDCVASSKQVSPDLRVQVP